MIKCWKQRNQIMCDPIKQKERMKRWHEKKRKGVEIAIIDRFGCVLKNIT